MDHAALVHASRAFGVDLRPAPSTSWLTERGHLDPYVRRHAPGVVIDALDDVHTSLGGDRRALGRLRATPLRGGFQLGSGQRVAIDDVGHFTTARLLSLASYPASLPFGFSIDQYRALIDTWRERAAAVFTRRATPDFDFAGGRRARRAYEDALVDLLAPVFTGMPVLRVATPDGDVTVAASSLRSMLA